MKNINQNLNELYVIGTLLISLYYTSLTNYHKNTFLNLNIYIFIYLLYTTTGWGESGFNCWGVRGPVPVLFLLYVNVSGTRPWSRFSSQPFTIPVPWVFLRVWWFLPLGDCLRFPCGKWGGWATTHHFLFPLNFPCLNPVLTPLLTSQRYSTFECWLLGLLSNNNNNHATTHHTIKW